jgi:hypothetical protein
MRKRDRLKSRFVAFCIKRLGLTIAIIASFFVVIISVGLFNASRRAESALVEQTLHREQVVARAGAKSIESFIKLASNSVVILASDYYVVNLGTDTQTILDEFANKWKDTPIVGVIIVDKEGTLRYAASTRSEVTTGVKIPEREYFKWAENAEKGKVFIGAPIMPENVKDPTLTVPLVTPIFNNDEFEGALLVPVILNQVTTYYLDPLKISGNTYVHLFDTSGTFLTSTGYPELTGVNYFDYIKQNPHNVSEEFLQGLKELTKNPREAKFIIPPFDPSRSKQDKLLVAVSPIFLGGEHDSDITPQTHWFLAVVTPIEDALVFFEPFSLNIVLAHTLFLLTIIVLSFFTIFLTYSIRNHSYMQGFIQGRDHGSEEVSKKKDSTK